MQTSTGWKLLVSSLIAVLAFTIVGVYYVWRHHKVIQMGANLGAATVEYKRLLKENELLKAEYETLKMSPDLEQRARGELGMEALDSKKVILVAPVVPQPEPPPVSPEGGPGK
jgi:cell division protein FtsL